MEQTKAIEDLNRSRDKLEKMKEKAEKQLMSAKSELGTAEYEAKEEKERARRMIEVVTSEMKMLKKSLEEAEKREKQVGKKSGAETLFVCEVLFVKSLIIKKHERLHYFPCHPHTGEAFIFCKSLQFICAAKKSIIYMSFFKSNLKSFLYHFNLSTHSVTLFWH